MRGGIKIKSKETSGQLELVMQLANYVYYALDSVGQCSLPINHVHMYTHGCQMIVTKISKTMNF